MENLFPIEETHPNTNPITSWNVVDTILFLFQEAKHLRQAFHNQLESNLDKHLKMGEFRVTDLLSAYSETGIFWVEYLKILQMYNCMVIQADAVGEWVIWNRRGKPLFSSSK